MTTERTVFLPYQKKWLADRSRFKIFEKSRRIGGTYVQAYEDIRDALEKPGLKIFFSSADLTASTEYKDYLVMWTQRITGIVLDALETLNADISDLKFFDDDKDATTKMLRLPNDSKIYLLSSNPSAFRSKGGKIVWDEAAWHEQDGKMWAAAKPAAMWGFDIRILSTHNGVSSVFNKLSRKAEKGEKGWAVHKVTIVDAVEMGLLDRIMGRKTTKKERDDFLASERAGCLTEEIWQQEYMCNPVDGSTAWMSYEEIGRMEKDGLLRELGRTTGNLYVGMDIARRRHFSVIYVLELCGRVLHVRTLKCMEKTPFRIQQEVLFEILRHPRVRRCAIDESGIGMMLAENAIEEFGRFTVEGISFTSAAKEKLAIGLKHESEEGTLLIPKDALQRESLHAIRKTVSTLGKARFDATADENGHADHFWALALAVYAARDLEGGECFVTPLSESLDPWQIPETYEAFGKF